MSTVQAFRRNSTHAAIHALKLRHIQPDVRAYAQTYESMINLENAGKAEISIEFASKLPECCSQILFRLRCRTVRPMRAGDEFSRQHPVVIDQEIAEQVL